MQQQTWQESDVRDRIFLTWFFRKQKKTLSTFDIKIRLLSCGIGIKKIVIVYVLWFWKLSLKFWAYSEHNLWQAFTKCAHVITLPISTRLDNFIFLCVINPNCYILCNLFSFCDFTTNKFLRKLYHLVRILFVVDNWN